MRKTGRQVFESEIFEKINRNVSVKEIVSVDGSNVSFKSCNTKWLISGLEFQDNMGNTWLTLSVSGKTVSATTQAPGISLSKGDVVTLPVFFASGTPVNLNSENKKKQNNNTAVQTPVVWLRETISGRDLPQPAPYSTSFDFHFYCLHRISNFNETNNEIRHRITFAMTQLNAEIMRIVDAKLLMLRDGDSQFREFNFFGKETQDGLEKYILNANLSGVENRCSILFDRKICNC